jgi:hypothetical protein
MIDPLRLVAEARQAYPGYYTRASPGETALFDGLVLARAAYLLGVRTPREGIDPGARVELERATDLIEKRFVEFRDKVCQTLTFRRLPGSDQRRVERELLPLRWFRNGAAFVAEAAGGA